MLWVWLFAILASWANACILQPSAAAENLGWHHERSGFVVQPGAEHEGAEDVSRAHDPDAALEACANFCDAEKSAVAKLQPAKGDGAADAATPVVASLASWPAIARGRPEVRWHPIAVPRRATTPVAIAFLRLTL
jgi:hypothetical protein